MSPAGCFDHRVFGTLVERPEPSVAVGLQQTAEVREVRLRPVALAVRCYGRSPYVGYEDSPRIYFKVANEAPRTYHGNALVLGVTPNDRHKAYPFEELASMNGYKINYRIVGQHVTIHWDEEAEAAWVEVEAGSRKPSTILYWFAWFAWFAFYPDTGVLVAAEDD